MPTCPLETRLKQEKRRIYFIGRNGPNDIACKFAVLSLSWPQDDGLQANYVALTCYISSRVCLLIFAHRD